MIVPPPPSSGKPPIFTDSESFPNYFTLKMRVQHGPLFSFCLRAGESFDKTAINRIEFLCSLYTVITFNGNYYDMPILSAALCGFTCEQLKWLSDEIILRDAKPWNLGAACEWRPPDHIDIMEVLPGAGGQKDYAGRIHSKTMRDLPYDPNELLSPEQIVTLDAYCENDLSVLEDEYNAAEPQRIMRDHLSQRYGIDLRSKSDAQLAEAVIKRRCEDAIGYRIYKPDIDWNLKFRYEAPRWLSFQCEPLRAALALIQASIFTIGYNGRVEMPAQLEGLEIPLGWSVYRLGIGGLHSSEKCVTYRSNADYVIRDNDVASYYPNLILNSGKYPTALGPIFADVYRALKDERIAAKEREKALKKAGDKMSAEYKLAHVENEGGKVMINGTFGKTGSPYSILFAPEMMIQTTVTGQLALLMLIEWHELQGIPVISANTDGMVIYCPRNKVGTSQSIIDYWQRATGLEMETTEYAALHSRDVNNYFAVLTPEAAAKEGKEVKRKGEYNQAGLVEKKSPDVEICGDAVAEYLSKGTPILYTVGACRNIRKFVAIQKVSGGAVKLWGHGPRKDMLVRDMIPTIQAAGWIKAGRKWAKGLGSLGEIVTDATTAYKSCFQPQMPEYLGKVVRWYYGVNSPGPIIYNTNGNHVSLSYGAQPCMTLPDEFPGDIDYAWYVENCEKMLRDVGFYGIVRGSL